MAVHLVRVVTTTVVEVDISESALEAAVASERWTAMRLLRTIGEQYARTQNPFSVAHVGTVMGKSGPGMKPDHLYPVLCRLEVQPATQSEVIS